ncbi:Histone-lysine N-methyltransferase setd3, partial [Exaiptasia diaphana]
MTRQNHVPISDTENIKALIPMWDMCNHSNGKIETGFDTEDSTCKSYAIRSFAKDDQVLIFYGKRNNADLLFHNGFVFPDNQHDYVNLHLGVSKSDKLYAMKAQIMAMVGLDASARPYPVCCGSNPISPELLTFLRIFSMDHDELKIRLFNPERKQVLPLSNLPKPESVVSNQNEIRLWNYLHMRLGLILAQYKTTIQEDDVLLQSKELTTNAKNCLLLRITERRILQNALG